MTSHEIIELMNKDVNKRVIQECNIDETQLIFNNNYKDSKFIDNKGIMYKLNSNKFPNLNDFNKTPVNSIFTVSK